MADAPPTPGIEVGELLHRVDAREPLLLLDVRNDEEFETWRLEGRHPVETVHVPYFDFIEDAEAAIARLPRGREIVVLCAQGGSSAMVVDLLRDAGLGARNVSGGMVAYGEYLEPVRVSLDSDTAELWQVSRRGKGCLSYVLRAGGDAIVVDPSRDVDWYERFVHRLGATIVRVLDTHVHADHVSGGPALAARSEAPYSVAAGEGIELRQVVEPLADGQELLLGADAERPLAVRVIATPGHTPGSMSYLVGRRHLLSGDLLFVGSVGRPDLGGHVVEWGRALFRTLRHRLAALSDDTVILPAHFAGQDEIGPDGVVAGRLGTLRQNVRELHIVTEGDFVAAMRAGVRPAPDAYAEIVRVNLGLAPIERDKVTEWELGKNECAATAPPASR